MLRTNIKYPKKDFLNVIKNIYCKYLSLHHNFCTFNLLHNGWLQGRLDRELTVLTKTLIMIT